MVSNLVQLLILIFGEFCCLDPTGPVSYNFKSFLPKKTCYHQQLIYHNYRRRYFTRAHGHQCFSYIHTHTHIYIYIYMFMCIYIYIYRYTTPKPLCQLMCPFTVFEKAGAKKVAIKCQTEEVCWFCYFFQKERHGFDWWTSIYLSIHPSLYLFIYIYIYIYIYPYISCQFVFLHDNSYFYRVLGKNCWLNSRRCQFNIYISIYIYIYIYIYILYIYTSTSMCVCVYIILWWHFTEYSVKY